MAFPYYQPYGSWVPQNFQAQNYQPQMQAQNYQQQTQPAASGIIWVSGSQEAQMYPVAPNNAVALWEQSGKTIYLKSADATGKPTMRVYDLVERSETASAASSATDVKLPDYATKDELGAIASAVKAVLSDIEQMKGDLYGLSGKRKTAKKAEVSDDDE